MSLNPEDGVKWNRLVHSKLEEDYLVPYAKSFQKDLKRFLEGRP